MTYATDTAKRQHRVGYYIKFEGIPTRIATHDMSAAGVSGTFIVCISEDSISGGELTLDRETHIVSGMGINWTCLANSDALTLFRRRGGDEDLLGGGISSTATSLTTDSGTSPYASNEVVYIGRETLLIGTDGGSGSYTSASRAQYGSYAVEHDADERMSNVPLFWYTRECTLVAVNLDTATEKELWWGSLSSEPVFRSGVIEFTATDRMASILKRPLMSGFREIEPSSTDLSSTNQIVLNLHNATDEYEFALGSYGGFLRVEAEGRVSIYRFGAANIGSSLISLSPNEQYIPNPDDSPASFNVGNRIVNAGIFKDNPSTKVRQVAYFRGHVGRAVAVALTSRIGNETNGAWDILPGRRVNETGAVEKYYQRKVGAGVPVALVDIATLQSMFAGTQHDEYWFDEPMEALAFLRAVAWRTGGYFYINDSGQFSWKEYAPYTVAAALTSYTATSEWIVSDAVCWDDETSAPSSAVIEANYDPFARKFQRRIELRWAEDSHIYGDRFGSVKYEARGMSIGAGTTASYTEAEAYLDRVRARRRYAGRRVSYILPWTLHATMVPGYRFRLTDSRLPDGEGGTGITARPYEVVSYRPDYGAGTVTIEADELPQGWLIAPCAEVTSWSSPTLTLSTTGSYGSGRLSDDASPGLDFPDGCTIRIYDRSATPPFSSSTTLTVTATAATTLSTSGTPSFTPAAGDMIFIDDSADTGNTNDVTADVQNFAYGADSSYLIGTGTGYERAGTRWT